MADQGAPSAGRIVGPEAPKRQVGNWWRDNHTGHCQELGRGEMRWLMASGTKSKYAEGEESYVSCTGLHRNAVNAGGIRGRRPLPSIGALS